MTTNTLAQQFASFLKEYRTKHELTQAEAAARVRLARATWADMERCRYQPTIATVQNITALLGVSPRLDFTPSVAFDSAKKL